MKSKRLVITLALGLGLTLVLLWVLVLSEAEVLSSGLSACAAPADLTVCPAGPPACDYASVQAAVDGASPGDIIKVAAGTYTDIHQRAGITQVVYISKTVTIRGGYTTANWTMPDPAANPTTLDARGLGRVLVITGTITPTVEGLRITGGDATELGGERYGRDAGGGVYIYEAAATISNCVMISNTASTASHGYGGGIYLSVAPAAQVVNNVVLSNTASTASGGYGGGMCLHFSNATLTDNAVEGNIASTASGGYGGGMYLHFSNATLTDNAVEGNTANAAGRGFGGGLWLSGSDATLSGNTVQGNTASIADLGQGGGLYLTISAATLSGNTIISNTATLNPTTIGQGGGLYVLRSSPFTLTNNLVADNHASSQGSGLYFWGSSAYPTSGHLLHTTIADNGSTGLTAGRGSGQGVYVDEYTTLAFTNTIIASHHSVGITVTTGSTVTLEATLWYGNGSHTGGGGYISTGAVNVYDDPAFVNPSVWDYHLTANSAAIDAGVDAGVTTDIDGDPRPLGAGYDIGADEYAAHIYLPIVLKAGLEAPH